MGQTVVGVGDPKAVKKFSAFLAVDTPKKSYVTSRLMGKEGSSMPIQQVDRLENEAGDTVSYDLLMQMTMQPREGDEVLEGHEQDMKFYSDEMHIEQMRGGVDTGGRMSRKRTLHELRKKARRLQSDWWARVFDELFFMYLCGARGINSDFVYPTTYTGFAGNGITAPDSEHLLFAGNKAKATLLVTDVMLLAEIDKAKTVAETMGGGAGGGSAGTDGNTQTPQIQPIKIDGELHYVCLMHPYQEYSVRTSAAAGQWLDIQKAMATAVGNKSQIFRGGMGMYNNVVLQSHRNIIRFSDYGAGSNIAAARALFLGEQAGAIAFGSPGTGLRFGWDEETRDVGNRVIIASRTIAGIKKTTYNGKDYGVMCIDTAAKAPNV